jgi:hypothetical protein
MYHVLLSAHAASIDLNVVVPVAASGGEAIVLEYGPQ